MAVLPISAIIPARAGSKRVVGKNLRDFGGKPLLVIAIETALKSEIFEHVIVSTEDEATIEVALKAGAEVPFRRPLSLSGDDVRADSVMAHAADFLSTHTKSTEICCLFPTTPGLVPKDLTDSAEEWMVSRAYFKALFAVTEYQQSAFRSFTISKTNQLHPLFPEKLQVQSQDLEGTYTDAGQFYFAGLQQWKTTTSITAETPSKGWIIPNYRAIDINTESDFALAKLSITRFSQE